VTSPASGTTGATGVNTASTRVSTWCVAQFLGKALARLYQIESTLDDARALGQIIADDRIWHRTSG
jgi:hypothetical protein